MYVFFSVSEVQRQLLSNRVSFHAVISEHKTVAYNPGQTLIFPTVKNEAGGGYKKETGIFTAPIAGKYIFSATITTDKSNQAIVASIKLNDIHLVALLAEGSFKQQTQGSVTTVQYLHAGDKVTVHMILPDNAKIWGGKLTSFAGCLIVPY